VDATAAAGGAELPDGAAFGVRALEREDVRIEGDGAIAAGDLGRGRGGESRQEDEGEKGRALQWCSMTRSTMLYSTASSALMK
jgi:hypothetical protein